MKQMRTNMNRRLQEHNKDMIASAEYRATEMKYFPSKLEERMISFLDSHHIFYEPQKIFYIEAADGWIITYYIADFFIPDKYIIVEVDGKFHDDHKQHDKMRTREIQEHYPGIEVLRYRWGDLSDSHKMQELLYRIR